MICGVVDGDGSFVSHPADFVAESYAKIGIISVYRVPDLTRSQQSHRNASYQTTPNTGFDLDVSPSQLDSVGLPNAESGISPLQNETNAEISRLCLRNSVIEKTLIRGPEGAVTNRFRGLSTARRGLGIPAIVRREKRETGLD